MDQMGHWILKNCAYFWPKISCDESFTISSHDLDEMLGRQFLIMSSHNSLLIGSLNDFSNCIVMKYDEIFFFLLFSLFSLFLISCQYFAFSP